MSTDRKTMQRAALEAVIARRDAILEMEVDAFDAVLAIAGPPTHMDELDADDLARLEQAEAGLAGWATQRQQVEREAGALAMECVPIAAIFLLPPWLKTAMFNAPW